jgi:hypothetical protein
MHVNNNLRAAMHSVSESFTPAWAYIEADPDTDGSYGKLNMVWKAGYPFPVGTEKWTGGCYLGTAGIALTSTSEGHPLPRADSSAIVALCNAIGSIVTTDQRIMGILSAGALLSLPIQASNAFIFSLKYSDVASAEPLFKKTGLGRPKLIGVKLNFAGTSYGSMHLVPERGLNHPWDRAKRQLWGRGVAESIWEDVVQAATGSRQSGLAEPVTFPTPEGASTLEALSSVLLLTHAVATGDRKEVARLSSEIRAIPIIDVMDAIGTFGNLIADQMTPSLGIAIRVELAAAEGTDLIKAAVAEVGHSLIANVNAQTAIAAMHKYLGGAGESQAASDTMLEIIYAAGRVSRHFNIHFDIS